MASNVRGGGKGFGTTVLSIRMLSLPGPKLTLATAMPVMKTGSRPVKVIVPPSIRTAPLPGVTALGVYVAVWPLPTTASTSPGGANGAWPS